MEKSNHKNYIEWFQRNRSTLVKNQIIPNEKKTFDLFSQKFSQDAEADFDRWRKILWTLWNLCANSCKEIHNILSWEVENNPELKNLAKDIINLDYESLWEIFKQIENEYHNKIWTEDIQKHLQTIYTHIQNMRKISKNHTNIISK